MYVCMYMCIYRLRMYRWYHCRFGTTAIDVHGNHLKETEDGSWRSRGWRSSYHEADSTTAQRGIVFHSSMNFFSTLKFPVEKGSFISTERVMLGVINYRHGLFLYDREGDRSECCFSPPPQLQTDAETLLWVHVVTYVSARWEACHEIKIYPPGLCVSL